MKDINYKLKFIIRLTDIKSPCSTALTCSLLTLHFSIQLTGTRQQTAHALSRIASEKGQDTEK